MVKKHPTVDILVGDDGRVYSLDNNERCQQDYGYMRIMVMFDLPTLTSTDKREYARFHKYLVKSGFLMMQESVYCKLALNTTVADADIPADYTYTEATGRFSIGDSTLNTAEELTTGTFH